MEKLFTNEKGFEGLSSDEIFKRRLENSKPILVEYWELLSTINAENGFALGKAVTYSINNKKSLESFLLDGRIELTNNRAERAVKPFVIGRKNWLFSDTDKGADAVLTSGQVGSMVFSIIESAKLNGLDVYGYLLYLLTELPKLGSEPNANKLAQLLPWTKMPDYCYIK